ncbi:alcohol dehydrogenase catalytic domain-containing protein [Cupriavidus necator]|uniref:alcohol dehydrogenase catalytic domain-containing protein n=1 Tax=Cupriavidus necator TaxID=106590 RepID=UPI00339DA226
MLRIEDVDVQPPARGQVRIRVRPLGLNRAEALLRAGTCIETPTLPSGLGLEAAGVVETVGGSVDSWCRAMRQHCGAGVDGPLAGLWRADQRSFRIVVTV